MSKRNLIGIKAKFNLYYENFIRKINFDKVRSNKILLRKAPSNTTLDEYENSLWPVCSNKKGK